MASRDALILQNMLGAQNELEEPQSVIGKLLLQLLENGGMYTGRNFTLVETVEITESGVSTIERTGYDFTKVFIRGRIAAGESGPCKRLSAAFNADGGRRTRRAALRTPSRRSLTACSFQSMAFR